MLHLGGGDYCRTVADHGYLCRCLGERHDGLPFAYGPDAPVSWHDGLAGDESSVLEQDFCIIQAEHFFLRGRLIVPVHDADQDVAALLLGVRTIDGVTAVIERPHDPDEAVGHVHHHPRQPAHRRLRRRPDDDGDRVLGRLEFAGL